MMICATGLAQPNFKFYFQYLHFLKKNETTDHAQPNFVILFSVFIFPNNLNRYCNNFFFLEENCCLISDVN